MTFEERCRLSEQCLPEAPYRMLLTNLHNEMLRELAEQPPQPPVAKPHEQEPLEYWNAVEGWVKLEEAREHLDSVGCGTIYKTAGEGRVPLCVAQPQQEPAVCGWWEHTSPVTGIKDVQDWQLTEADKASGWIEQPLYTTPPQRTWVNATTWRGLSDDEALECWPGLAMYADCAKFWENIESKLKEKNEAAQN